MTVCDREADIYEMFVTAEEHQIFGGLGSAVSQVVSQNYPIPVEFVGVQDTYAESGQPDELFEKYGLTSKNIAQAAERAISHKVR